MKAIVLAAGKGTRMLPLTKNTPKHLLPVAGRPFIEWFLDRLASAGVTEVGFVVGYKKEKFDEFFKNKNLPIKITLIEQQEQLGTADALRVAENFVDDDPFLVLMGDNLYSSFDLERLAAVPGMAIAAFEVDDPSRYGVLEVSSDKLVRTIEKPQNPPSNLINTGAYKFTKDIFDAIRKIRKSPRGEFELTDALNILARSKPISVVKLKTWEDFGKLEDIPKLDKLLRNEPSVVTR